MYKSSAKNGSCYFLFYLLDDFGIGSHPRLVEIDRSLFIDFSREEIGL